LLTYVFPLDYDRPGSVRKSNTRFLLV